MNEMTSLCISLLMAPVRCCYGIIETVKPNHQIQWVGETLILRYALLCSVVCSNMVDPFMHDLNELCSELIRDILDQARDWTRLSRVCGR